MIALNIPVALRVLQLTQTVNQSRIYGYSAADTKQMEHYAADAEMIRLLPLFGWEVFTPTASSQTPYYAKRAWRQNRTTLTQRIQELARLLLNGSSSETLPNGYLQQQITANTVHSVWREMQQRWPIPLTRDEESIVFSVILLHIAVAFWELTPDEGLTRAIEPTPLNTLTEKTYLQVPSAYAKDGISAPCVGWATLPKTILIDGEASEHDRIVYFSGVGSHKRLKSLWATLMDAKAYTITLPWQSYRGQHAKRYPGKAQYLTMWNDQPLEQSGLAHLAIHHISQFQQQANQPFLHLVGEAADGAPDLDWFAVQFDRASLLPIAPEWIPALWQIGCETNLIMKLESYRCTAYWVRADKTKEWGIVIANIAQGATSFRHARWKTAQTPVDIIGTPVSDDLQAIPDGALEDDDTE